MNHSLSRLKYKRSKRQKFPHSVLIRQLTQRSRTACGLFKIEKFSSFKCMYRHDFHVLLCINNHWNDPLHADIRHVSAILPMGETLTKDPLSFFFKFFNLVIRFLLMNEEILLVNINILCRTLI
jgi:hypothetical protein